MNPKASPSIAPLLAFLSVLALGSVVISQAGKGIEGRTREDMLRAAAAMERALGVLREEAAARGIVPDPALDPGRSGLVGLPWSGLTTTLGSLPAKRTGIQPDAAALFARRYREAGIRSGDLVAIDSSGSFPGFAVAAIVAAESLGARPRVIVSVGASTWGANRPEYTLSDMLFALERRGMVSAAPLAVSAGGAGDLGTDMDPAELRAAMGRALATGATLIEAPGREASIAARRALFDADGQAAILVSIGGNWTSQGLVEGFRRDGVAVFELLDVAGLCAASGLSFDPSSPPAPGTSALYGIAQSSRIIAAAAIALALLAATVARIAGGMRRNERPSPLVTTQTGDAMPTETGPMIHLSFRFHVNLYHSYRGDSLDERGIGKDIRIIRGLLDDLDSLNAEGIPVRGAWDIENYYSLELYLPRHAPDIIERIRARVAAGLDEVEPMSFNNGILTAHTREEFEETIGRAITNPAGSGLRDLFGEWAPIVRPQECMFSTSQIAGYRKLGIEVLSVYYSAAPFNGFGSFVPLLGIEERHNPLLVRDAATGASMRLLPACSPADIIEHGGSLRRWLKALRRGQFASGSPRDLILLIDMDADDSFWAGFLPGFAAPVLPSLCGFAHLVRSVARLPWLRFSRPWDYVRGHDTVGEVSFGQDLADGSFDGYSSWSEKAENARLWPRIARARRLAELAARIAVERSRDGLHTYHEAADAARTAILRSLSTTHFGMASPVMNAERLCDAFRIGEEANRAAEALLAQALAQEAGAGGSAAPSFYFDPRIDALPRGGGAVTTLAAGGDASGEGSFALEIAGESTRLLALNPASSRVSTCAAIDGGGGLVVGKDAICAGGLELAMAPGGGVTLSMDGTPVFEAPLSRPWVRYGLSRRGSRAVSGERGAVRELLPGRVAQLRVEGLISLTAAAEVRWTHVYTLVAGLSTLRVDVLVDYPRTARRGFDRAKALRLAREWDARWREVAPFELVPALGASAANPARVWKHGFDDAVGSYVLDYHRLGPNRDIDSLDNHVTDGWVAVSGGGRGLLLAQADSAQTLFAFCPMRLRFQGEKQLLMMNPFGSYHGRQWRYPAATTGLGRLAAIAVGDNYDPYAPSWEDGRLRFTLMIAPYAGDRPPENLQRDALLFATTPVRA